MVIYDVVVVGSGLGGMVSALILAKEGLKVLILEKNNQYGGNLQTFVRDKTIFDTGVHYIGALGEGENLHQYFKYLDLLDGLQLSQLCKDGYDRITFDNDPIEYPHAQGHQNFIDQLLVHFPDEKEALETYCRRIKEVCDSFPLYNLQAGDGYDIDVLSINTYQFIDQLTNNQKLKSVLAGTTYLYSGIKEKSPFYVHALSVNSYIQSAWRVVKGGSQITKELIKQLKKHNVTILRRKEISEFVLEDDIISSVKTKSGETYYGKLFISNIDFKTTLKMVGEDNFRKSFLRRIKNLEPSISTFSLYVVLKPKSFKYLNYNYYHMQCEESVWDSQSYTEESWPKSYMVSMGLKNKDDEWADSISFLTYMHYDDVKEWEDTHNTVVNKNSRGETYEEFKNRKTEKFLIEIEKKFKGLRACIKSVYTSTPLSYRDYIGVENGYMYGYIKDSNHPMNSFISPRTKIPNLFLTGQSLNMHGVLGVTIGAVTTCSEILGKDYLINKINKELAEKSTT